jgi:hypothetical protein
MLGMTMIGEMSNISSKARVEGHCTDLAALVTGRGEAETPQAQDQSQPGGLGGEPRKTMEPMKPMESRKRLRETAPWWPEGLGQPTTAGGQDDLRYAYFASRRRLAVSRRGEVTVYDTAEHEISDVSRQPGSDRTGVVFTGQHGEVPIAGLKVVGH